MYDLIMPVSLHKKIVRGHPYWYARECQRVNGKPKIVWQKYLGKAEHIASAMGAPSAPARPEEILLCDFGAPAALYDLTQQLDLIATIDRHAGKRDQGMSVGTYMALAALNRCLAPTSKAGMAEWYQGTVLRRLLPVASNQLTSQRFWDHMELSGRRQDQRHRTGSDPHAHQALPGRPVLSACTTRRTSTLSSTPSTTRTPWPSAERARSSAWPCASSDWRCW